MQKESKSVGNGNEVAVIGEIAFNQKRAFKQSGETVMKNLGVY